MACSVLAPVCVVVGAYMLYSLVQIIRTANQPGLGDVPGPFVARYSNLVLKWNVIAGSMVRISPDEVAVADLAASRIIHNAKDGFPKGVWYAKLAPFVAHNPGMFSMLDNKQHGVRRRLFSQGFSKTAILAWEEPIKARVRIAVAKIKRDALAGSADILKWWTLLANDVACELFFGQDFDALGGEKKPPVVRDMEVSMIIGGMSAEFHPLMPILGRLPVPALQHAFAVWDRLRAFGEVAIENTRASSANKTVFTKMAGSGEKLQLSEDAISQEASNLTIAGTDTTALALTYLVWAVLSHPEVKQKLQAELLTCRSEDPLGKELETLPYLNNVIDETLRLFTPIHSSLPRAVPTGGTTLCGYGLPQGTTVSTQAYTFHRDPAIYPDPLRFNPDRWQNPTKEMKEAFFAWGAGGRGCLGTHIAKLELMHATLMFFRTCGEARIVPTTTPASMDYADFFLMAPYGGKCEIKLK